MNAEQAIERLERQLIPIADVKRFQRESPEFKKWHRDTEVAIERIFGPDTRHIKDFTSIHYFLSLRYATSSNPATQHHKAYTDGLDKAAAVLHSMIDEIREDGLAIVTGIGAVAVDSLSVLRQICSRFPIICRQLKVRHDSRSTLEVQDEYDVQDLLHCRLLLYFDDVRAEDSVPSHAGGSSRVDFILKAERVVVEAKKSRKGLDAKKLGEELIIDIERYRAHPNCEHLVCFVYDPEHQIVNPRGIEADLSRIKDGLNVTVIIAPI
jgi:hypothetical protein